CMLDLRSVVYTSLVYQLSHTRRNDDDSSGSGFQDHSPPLRYFWGLDVAKKNMAVTFTDHEALMRSLRLPYSSAHLLHYVRKHFPDRRVAFVYEAGPTGFGLHDELVTAGYRCLVVAPSMVPTAPGDKVKTNRLDSRKLSVQLRGGELRSIHVPALRYRELRHLVQLRDTQVG